VVDHTDYREKSVLMSQNPITAAPWTLADIASTFTFGIANVAAVGATEELRVSELTLEMILDHG
jgi:hypothetical protein